MYDVERRKTFVREMYINYDRRDFESIVKGQVIYLRFFVNPGMMSELLMYSGELKCTPRPALWCTMTFRDRSIVRNILNPISSYRRIVVSHERLTFKHAFHMVPALLRGLQSASLMFAEIRSRNIRFVTRAHQRDQQWFHLLNNL